jgi:Family of unknown function (DUF5985)
MAVTVYIIGALTSLACALLLLRQYTRVKQKLLLWSGVCFAGLTLSNLLVFLDLVVFTDVDLYAARLVTAVLSMGVLLYGLIWESN